MLADFKLPTTFWAEAVNTACYVQNRVLVVKPHNKTPYELFYGRTPELSFMRPFGCHVTILNTVDHLGKFNGKVDDGFFVGYSLNSKAFRVFNSRTRIVEENFPIRFSESTPNVVGSRPDWLFDIDALTRTMNYKPIVAGTQSNVFADQEKEDNVNSTNNVNTVNAAGTNEDDELPFDPNMPALEDVSIFNFSNDDEDDGIKKDESGIVMRNKARLVTKRHTEEERIDCDEVFAPVVRIEVIRLFLAYASFKDFVVYQMDVKSTFFYGKIEKEVYVCQPPGFKDTYFLDRAYKVEKALYGLHQAPRACTPMETQRPLLKDEDGEEVDVHMYRNFRYLKGQPRLGFWYPKDLSFDLVAYTDSDYARASLDRKSTTRDGKKIIITEASIRRDLQLAVEEGGGPKCQETIRDTTAQTRFESVSTHSNDSLLARGGEEVFVAEQEVVKDVNANVVEKVVNAAQDNTATTTITTEEITLAQALEASKTSKPKVKGIVIHKQEELDEKEKDDLKQLMETIPDEEEVAIDAIPLAVKSFRIVDLKIHKVGKKSYYQIVKANEKSQIEEISPYTTYTFNDDGKEASN
nr:retrovirus-related Pol polyprotein from transposon TNT 1-94 [Tanacetum cinerariifolium]